MRPSNETTEGRKQTMDENLRDNRDTVAECPPQAPTFACVYVLQRLPSGCLRTIVWGQICCLPKASITASAPINTSASITASLLYLGYVEHPLITHYATPTYIHQRPHEGHKTIRHHSQRSLWTSHSRPNNYRIFAPYSPGVPIDYIQMQMSYPFDNVFRATQEVLAKQNGSARTGCSLQNFVDPLRIDAIAYLPTIFSSGRSSSVVHSFWRRDLVVKVELSLDFADCDQGVVVIRRDDQ